MMLGMSPWMTALFVIAGCQSGGSIQPLPAGGRHVLFIGNSLTYANDLPATVAAIADAAGDTVRVTTVADANMGLIDHALGQSEAVAVVKSQRWDSVVLQQGPTPPGLCRDTLILATKLLDPLVRAAGGRTALFMTWPTSAGSSAFFDEVRISFQMAAQSVGGVFLPAGEAWRAAWARDRSLPLYGPDGYHPSPLGSFLAALTIYERLSGKDARSLPLRAFTNGIPMSVPESTIRLLQEAAHQANVEFSDKNQAGAPSTVDHVAGARLTC
jgi:hypothetical protein